jgi:Caspase recruitment domain
MDQLWENSLLENRESILRSADSADVLLNHLLDHLFSEGCIQRDQKEKIKKHQLSRNRMGALIDFLLTENKTAFDELCNALESFGNDAKQQLARILRQSLRSKSEEHSRQNEGILYNFTSSTVKFFGKKIMLSC